jgi:hypothetical protein
MEWQKDGVSYSQNESINFTLNADTTMTAVYSGDSYYTLTLSSDIALPAPDEEGGTTNPGEGAHSYSAGSSVNLEAIPDTGYRFMKWTGDTAGIDDCSSQIQFVMDTNKSITAVFCTGCGDPNGDLAITPGDAQTAFDIYLERIANLTDAQNENADVNCDGTKDMPIVTPGDAQSIFEKYLERNELPGDCSCGSRSASGTLQEIPARLRNISLGQIEELGNNEIALPIMIDDPADLDAFGFDVMFPSDQLTFLGVQSAGFVRSFDQVDGHIIADGITRIGGYSIEPIREQNPGVLVKLIFRVTDMNINAFEFNITRTVDDIKGSRQGRKEVIRENIRR